MLPVVLFGAAYCCVVVVGLGDVVGTMTRGDGDVVSLWSARIEKGLDFREVREVFV